MKTYVIYNPRTNLAETERPTLGDAIRYAVSRNVPGLVVRLKHNGDIVCTTRTEKCAQQRPCAMGDDDYAIATTDNPVTHVVSSLNYDQLDILFDRGYKIGSIKSVDYR